MVNSPFLETGMDDNLTTTHPLAREPFAAPRIAALSSAGQRRPIAVVLGMHRSGTSLCAHILSAMGIDMADEIGAAASNAKGHWERLEIVEAHDRILRLFNRDYFGPLHDLPLPAAWWADPRVFQIKREIVAFLARRMGDSYFGFKDPRTVRLMPLWHQIFNDLKLAPKIVLCLRNPAQVARSLKERDNLDPRIGEYRWLNYVVDVFRYCGGFEVCTVDYERWFRDPCANFEKLKQLLDVEWQQSRSDLDLVLSSIVDPALRHDEPHYDEPHQPLVRSLYRLVSDCGPVGGVHDEIDKFVAQFVGFQNLQAPLYPTLDTLAAAAATCPNLEQETAALRADIEQRAATEAALRADFEQCAATEAVLRADIEQRNATEAALRADIEQRNATEVALRADIEQRNATEAALRADIEQRAATEAGLRADIEQRAATEATLRADIEQRTTTEAALRAELEVARRKLLEAEQHERESKTALSALQHENSSLRSEIDAAREVGGAALEALRYNLAGPHGKPRRATWRIPMLRHFRPRAREQLPLGPAVADHR
jgi:hypothetical protein